jgi:hypothetical protein
MTKTRHKRRRRPNEEQLREAAFAAIRQIYIETLSLWRVCPRGFCRRHQCCLQNNRSCLQRGWPLLSEDAQEQAYEQVRSGGPRRLPAATELERSLRGFPPTNFVR